MATNSISVCKNIDFTPDNLIIDGLRVGFIYGVLVEFRDKSTKALIDISGDTFQMIIKNSSGATVSALTLGFGLSFDDDNTLLILIGTDVTDDDGTYTYLMEWSITETGANIPAFEGKIIVE